MVNDSLQTIPFKRAARLLPVIFENNAIRMIPIVYPQIVPVSNRPMFVFNPDRAKYLVRWSCQLRIPMEETMRK